MGDIIKPLLIIALIPTEAIRKDWKIAVGKYQVTLADAFVSYTEAIRKDWKFINASQMYSSFSSFRYWSNKKRLKDHEIVKTERLEREEIEKLEAIRKDWKDYLDITNVSESDHVCICWSNKKRLKASLWGKGEGTYDSPWELGSNKKRLKD